MIEEPFVSAGAGGEEEPGRMSKRAHFGEERERGLQLARERKLQSYSAQGKARLGLGVSN